MGFFVLDWGVRSGKKAPTAAEKRKQIIAVSNRIRNHCGHEGDINVLRFAVRLCRFDKFRTNGRAVFREFSLNGPE